MPVICCSMLVMGHLKNKIIKTHEIMFGIIPVNAKNLHCNNFFLEEVVHYRNAEATRLLSMAAVCETFIQKRMTHTELAIMYFQMVARFPKTWFCPLGKISERQACVYYGYSQPLYSNLSNVT